jgi:hypothetical protein
MDAAQLFQKMAGHVAAATAAGNEVVKPAQ